MSLMPCEAARFNMIEQQIRPWDVSDPAVLRVMHSVPRENFVPASWRDMAFADLEVPLGHGQFMFSPKLEGRILQALKLKPTDQIFEVGTGSGFLSACMSQLAAHVLSVEYHQPLADQARDNLQARGITGVTVTQGDALALCSDQPDAFDAIVIGASMPEYDGRFEQMLKPRGRLFCICGKAPAMQARLVTKDADGQIQQQILFETVLEPALTGLTTHAAFTF